MNPPPLMTDARTTGQALSQRGPGGWRGEAPGNETPVVSASSDLLAQLMIHAPRDGAFGGMWPGLTVCRSIGSPPWSGEKSSSLALGIVAQRPTWGDGAPRADDPFSYLVLGDGLRPRAHGLNVASGMPCWSLVLQIDPAIARRISAEIAGYRGPRSVTVPSAGADEPPATSALDEELTSAVARFLRSLSGGPDRRVLGPIYLQEIVFRVLQREQAARMLQIAGRQIGGNPIAPALVYLSARLAEPLTVGVLAAQTSLSVSAFTRAFRDVTGRSPYQFVKEARLNRGRELVIEGGRPVAEVSRAVGYASVSHFIKEFRSRFGATPGEYADALGRDAWHRCCSDVVEHRDR